MAFKRPPYRNEEERMATQMELLKALRAKAPTAGGEERPAWIKFSEQNVPIQGIVKEVFATTVYDPHTKAPAVDKNGDTKPQLTVTLELEDGTLRRQGFQGDLLWKLSDALEELGLEELPIGALIGSAWIGMWNNTRAREHTVKIKVA